MVNLPRKMLLTELDTSEGNFIVLNGYLSSHLKFTSCVHLWCD